MTGQLIRVIVINGLTDDGASMEITTIRVIQTEEGFEVNLLLNGSIVDGQSCDTRVEAERTAREWAIEAHKDYQDEARERKAAERRTRRDIINDTAAEFSGDDAQALRMVAALIGQGRSKAAVEALRALRPGRREK